MVEISPEKVCFVIYKAREFDAKDAITEDEPGSNPSDDRMAAVLEDHRDDPTVQELTSFIQNLNVDEQIDLVTLAWLGRGDYTEADWDEVRAEAEAAHNERTALYLLGMPLLSEYLEQALAMMGYSCDDVELEHL